MSEDPVLFEVPEDAWVIPPPPEKLTRGQRRKRLVAQRIAAGVHPLGRPVLLHPDASRDPEDHETGPRCGQCRFRQLVKYHNRTWPKCWFPDVDVFPHPRDTHCESSDIRITWPACREYQPAEYLLNTKPIPNHPEYRISPDGVVYHPSGKILSGYQEKRTGYIRVRLNNPPRRAFIHDLVLETYSGPRPAGLEACHGNGIPDDNQIGNLRWDTHAANIEDLVAAGTHSGWSKTHCPRNHPYDEQNTYLTPDGARGCKECRRDAVRRYREDKRERTG